MLQQFETDETVTSYKLRVVVLFMKHFKVIFLGDGETKCRMIMRAGHFENACGTPLLKAVVLLQCHRLCRRH